MEYIEVLDTSQLAEGEMKKVEVRGKQILIANLDGSYHAIANKCSHLGGSLAKGSLEGAIVTCPRHGAKFDLKTGESVGDARIAVLKMGVKDVDSYPVKIKGTEILVGISDH